MASSGNRDLHEFARPALLEITGEESIGAPAGTIDEGDGVTSVLFESAQLGYPGWKWTVTVADLDGALSVLEAELMPGDGALLSPDWVPWSDRLAEYNAAQAAAAEDPDAASSSDSDSDSDDDDDDDDDPDDDDDEAEDDSDDEDDDLGSDVLHGGDLDGVDIDDLDEASDEDSDDSDDDESDDEGDDRSY